MKCQLKLLVDAKKAIEDWRMLKVTVNILVTFVICWLIDYVVANHLGQTRLVTDIFRLT